MKTTVAVTALLASIAFAQPYHGRHLHKKDLHKRKLVTVTTICTETATLLIDQDGTTLIEPTPAQFYPSTTSDDTTSTTSTSTSSTSTPMSKPTTLSTSTTSTSAYVQPQPTTPTQAQETTPTTTPEAPAYTQTTSEAAAPTSGSGSGSSGSGGSYSGDITFYEIGLGSCGIDSSGQNPSGTSPSDPAVIALPKPQMEVWTGNPNSNPLCGKIIKITANGKTGYGKVMDTCGDCLLGSIDTNEGAFSHFYDLSKGRAPCSWEFM